MITRKEILKSEQCPPEYEENLLKLLEAVNKVRAVWNHPMYVNSGYRTPEHNKMVGGSPRSAHLSCQAVDIDDTDMELQDFLLANKWLLTEAGLYMEDPAYTRKGKQRWVHLQIRPTKNRIFRPYA